MKYERKGWVLESGIVRFSISRTHGNIESGAIIKGQELITPCWDQYIQENEARHLSDERYDELEEDSYENTEKGEKHLRIICRNRDFNVQITKEYWLRRNEPNLIKRVTISPAKEFNGFLRIRSVVNLDKNFRKGSFYYTPSNSWHHLNRKDPAGLVKSSEIRETVKFLSGFENKMVTVFNPKTAKGVGHFRFKVNGHIVPWQTILSSYGKEDTTNTLEYNPSGWSFETLIIGQNDKSALSSEVHYVLYEGDYLDFLQSYKNLPEYRKSQDYNVSQWSRQIKLLTFALPNPDLGNEANFLKSLAEELGEGYLALVIVHWSYSGDYETSGVFPPEVGPVGIYPGIKTDKVSAEWLKEAIARIKSTGKVKVGLYVASMWLEELSNAFKAHPDWVIREKNGNPHFTGMKDQQDGGLHWLNPLRKDLSDHLCDRIKKLTQYYDIDWLHNDGGLGVDLKDYSTGRAILPSYFVEMSKRFKDAVKEINPEIVYCLNTANTFPGEISYQETPTFENASGLKWQSVTDLMLVTKIFQEDKRTLVPLYWKKENVAAEKIYIVYLLAFGFTPFMDGWKDIQWVRERRVYLDMAYLLRDSEIIPSSRVVSPLWWKDGSMVESFALKLGQARLFPIINHSDKSEDVSLSINCKEAELDEELPAFLWLIEPFEETKFIPFSYIMQEEGKIKTRLKVNRGVEGMRIVLLSQIPVFVYSINGNRLPLYLPTTREVGTIMRNKRKGGMDVSVIVKSEMAEILMPVELGMTLKQDVISEEQPLQIGGFRFRKIGLAKGTYQLKLAGALLTKEGGNFNG